VRRDLPAAKPARSARQGLRDSEHIQHQNLVIHKLMEDQGVKPQRDSFRGDGLLRICPKRWPPRRSMRISWVSPMARKPNWDGSGKVLYYAKDIWPHFISCVLVVNGKS